MKDETKAILSMLMIWMVIAMITMWTFLNNCRIDMIELKQEEIIETQNFILDIQESTIELQGDMIKIDQDIIELI